MSSSRFALLLTLLVACGGPPSIETEPSAVRDVHSYANTDEVRVKHVSLDLDVDFETETLDGAVTLELERLAESASTIVLDTRDLTIHSADISVDGETFETAAHELGAADPILGAPLTIPLPDGATHVRVRYRTSPAAMGLQWLEPAQTAGKRRPYLYSQSQAIQARSWIPLQDTPGVRAPYSAVIRTPPDLVAVMSAENDPDGPRDGEFEFEMPQAIPSYLIALAVGDIAFQPMSERTGVYAEPSVVEAAAEEFADTEKMMQAVEPLFGPYRWGRYDILVLPPSFPFGGMENPRLTFATPTLLAGDRSLVSVIAHELAHSWSGNLVTNATWRDFWLNEGFTVYLENRIQEAVFGVERSAMEAALEVTHLEEEMAELPDHDEVLHVNLDGRDPDEGFTLVPYVKGMLLLRTLERAVGREKWDRFLREYFDRFAFQSITTADFLSHLRENLPEAAAAVDLEAWTEQAGLPADAARPVSDALARVDAAREGWLAGEVPAAELPFGGWSTQERLQLLTGLPDEVSSERMAELDAAFGLTASANAEVIARWLQESLEHGYEPPAVHARLEEFLLEVGRRKFLEPLYKALVKTEDGQARAQRIYRAARPGYHPMAQATVDQILGVSGD